MGSPWRLREGFATSSRALHEDVAGADGFEKPSRRLREGFAKASAILTEASWSLLEGFAKAPRAPSFGNDSSDNDKPPKHDWKLRQLDVKQAFIPADLDFNVFMKFPDGRGDKSGKVVKLNKPVYGLKQAGRRWAMHLGDVIVRKVGMEQCKADPCVFRLIRDGVVVMIVCAHVNGITVAGESEACDFLSTCLLEEFQTTGGELSWYLGCAFERDRKRGVLRASQRAFIDSVVSRYGVDAVSDLPASQSADLGPTRDDEPVCYKPVCAAVGSLIWLGGMTRPDIANAVRAVARQVHDPADRHWRVDRKIIAYLKKTKDPGLIFVKDGDRKLSVYIDADYAN